MLNVVYAYNIMLPREIILRACKSKIAANAKLREQPRFKDKFNLYTFYETIILYTIVVYIIYISYDETLAITYLKKVFQS